MQPLAAGCREPVPLGSSWGSTSTACPPFAGGKLRHGVMGHTYPEQQVGKRPEAGLWGPAHGRLGFPFLMLGIKG